MRKIELSEEDGEVELRAGTAIADRKVSPDQVLKSVDVQLRAFALEIVMFDTGSDEYIWKIETRTPARRQRQG